MPPDAGCAVCGAPTKVFTSSGKRAKFCDVHTRKRVIPVRGLVELSCLNCGVKFTQAHGKQLFCSRKCRRAKEAKNPIGRRVVKNANEVGVKNATKADAVVTHVPNQASKRKVASAAGLGMSHEDIALGLGVSRTTLEKYYEFELSTGAYAKRLEVAAAMHRAAKKGNVAAQKAYLALDPKLAVPPLPAEDKPAKLPELGKKAQANVDAASAGQGGEWGDLLKPTAAKETTH